MELRANGRYGALTWSAGALAGDAVPIARARGLVDAGADVSLAGLGGGGATLTAGADQVLVGATLVAAVDDVEQDAELDGLELAPVPPDAQA